MTERAIIGQNSDIVYIGNDDSDIKPVVTMDRGTFDFPLGK